MRTFQHGRNYLSVFAGSKRCFLEVDCKDCAGIIALRSVFNDCSNWETDCISGLSCLKKHFVESRSAKRSN